MVSGDGNKSYYIDYRHRMLNTTSPYVLHALASC
jgi:hypothetical protein